MEISIGILWISDDSNQPITERSQNKPREEQGASILTETEQGGLEGDDLAAGSFCPARTLPTKIERDRTEASATQHSMYSHSRQYGVCTSYNVPFGVRTPISRVLLVIIRYRTIYC